MFPGKDINIFQKYLTLCLLFLNLGTTEEIHLYDIIKIIFTNTLSVENEDED